MVALAAQADMGGYHIQKCVVTATLHEDNTLDVKEQYHVMFHEPRHGIYREIPTEATITRDISPQQDGSSTHDFVYHVDVDNLWVNKEYSDDEEDGTLSIRIGNADRRVLGPQYYEIRYTMTLEDDRTDAADLFYYTAFGPEWDCKVDHLIYRLTLEKPVPEEYLDLISVYAGPYGGNRDLTLEDDAVYIDTQGHTVIQGQLYDLLRHDAVTYYIPLPEGYFQNERTCWWLPVSYITLALLIFTAITLTIYLLRPGKHITVSMDAFPPDGMTSAEVGTIIDDSADTRDLVSLIPWLAHHGYISIDETGKDICLHKLKDMDDKAPAYLKKFMKTLFRKNTELTLKGQRSVQFGKDWADCMTKLQAEYTGKKELSTISTPGTWGMIALILLAALAGWACMEDHTYGAIIGACYAGGLTFIALMRGSTASADQVRSKGMWALHIITYMGALTWLILLWIALSFDDSMLGETYYLIPALALAIVPTLLAGKLVIPTDYKVEMQGRLLGLRKFIRESEKPMLEQLTAQEEHYFYDILPYAIAMGEGERWAKKFKNICMTEPEWYQGRAGTHFSTTALNASLNSSLAHGLTNCKTPSSSGGGGSFHSSGGGGGFSGGGFGGGGGGSW